MDIPEQLASRLDLGELFNIPALLWLLTSLKLWQVGTAALRCDVEPARYSQTDLRHSDSSLRSEVQESPV